MSGIIEIERRLEEILSEDPCTATPLTLLHLGESCLECWVEARGDIPTTDTREGFRLLALHRQGSQGDPSFNACRETCRELVYHYNLLEQKASDGDTDVQRELKMMALVANHLCLFISGKMQVAELGDFCCSSAPVRDNQNELTEVNNA